MPTRFNGDFYSTAAQVLPVLFLAAAVELRLFIVSEQDVRKWVSQKAVGFQLLFNFFGVTSYALTLGLGEWAALRALHEERTFSTTDPFVVGALLASGVVLTVTPLVNMLEAAREETKYSITWTLIQLLVAVVFTVAVAAMPVYGLGKALGM